VGDQTLIYHGRWRNSGTDPDALARDYYAETALATLPRDRWGWLGLNPGAAEGTICSTPLTLDAGLRVNVDGAAGLRVELWDEQYRPIDGFGAGTVEADGLRAEIRWPGRQPAELAGQRVRIAVRLRPVQGVSPRVYAVYAG
jgi:hypothetical protein